MKQHDIYICSFEFYFSGFPRNVFLQVRDGESWAARDGAVLPHASMQRVMRAACVGALPTVRLHISDQLNCNKLQSNLIREYCIALLILESFMIAVFVISSTECRCSIKQRSKESY